MAVLKSKPAPKAAATPKAASKPVNSLAPAKANGKAPSGPGVIQALVAKLRDGGGTPAELYDHLAALFPDRATVKGGMHTTIAIQLKRLPKEGKLAIALEEVEGRGIVYRAEA